MSEKLELVKKCTFAKMPELSQHDWNDMLQSEGYITFLNGVEDAIDKYLSKHAIAYAKFINANYTPSIRYDNMWQDFKTGTLVSEQHLIDAYNEYIANPIRESKHFEDDGAYAD